MRFLYLKLINSFQKSPTGSFDNKVSAFVSRGLFITEHNEMFCYDITSAAYRIINIDAEQRRFTVEYNVVFRYCTVYQFVGTGEKIDDLQLFDAEEFTEGII